MPYTVFSFGDPSIHPTTLNRTYLSGLSVHGGADAPVWPQMTFCSGVVGVAYSEQFDLAPVGSPTTFTVLSGTLPPGLSLANVSGDIGLLSGTPTTAGAYTFTLRATSAYGTSDQAFSITVSAGAGGGGGSWTWVS